MGSCCQKLARSVARSRACCLSRAIAVLAFAVLAPTLWTSCTTSVFALLISSFLFLVVRPGAPSSVRSLLVAMPGAPSSFLLLVVRGVCLCLEFWLVSFAHPRFHSLLAGLCHTSHCSPIAPGSISSTTSSRPPCVYRFMHERRRAIEDFPWSYTDPVF